MPTPVLAVVLAAVSALAISLSTPALLRWLPAPEEAPEVRFAALASPRFRLGVLVAGFGFGWLCLALSDPLVWPILLPLAALGSLLGFVDARTTFLPLRLHYLTAALVAAGVVASAGLRGQWWSLAWGAGVAAVATGVYALVWWWSGGQLGFGDVRLAGLIGLATASVSPALAAWSLLLGSLIGAAWAIAVRATGSKEFAYGPSMLLGVPAGLIVGALIG